MKTKIKLFFTVLIVALTLNSCSKKDALFELKDNTCSDNMFQSNDFNNLGQLHNDAVAYILQTYQSELLDLINNGDTIGAMNLIQNASLEYIANSGVYFNGVLLDTTSVRLSNSNLLSLRNRTLVDTSDDNYFKGFDVINSSYSISQYNNELAEIKNNNANISDTSLYIPLFLSVSIGKASGEFWYEKELNNQIAADKWVSLGLSDLYGAYGAGLWGSFLGPAGAVLMGVNGAIISSCSSYLIDNVLP